MTPLHVHESETPMNRTQTWDTPPVAWGSPTVATISASVHMGLYIGPQVACWLKLTWMRWCCQYYWPQQHVHACCSHQYHAQAASWTDYSCCCPDSPQAATCWTCLIVVCGTCMRQVGRRAGCKTGRLLLQHKLVQPVTGLCMLALQYPCNLLGNELCNRATSLTWHWTLACHGGLTVHAAAAPAACQLLRQG